MVTLRTFPDSRDLNAECVSLIREHTQILSRNPYAIMLSGGRTPLPVYNSLAAHPISVPDNLRIMLSDERMAPEASPANNFSHMAAMISALRIPADHVLKVDTTLPHDQAAARYDTDLSAFFAQNGRLTLALLGLGADGHTASIFSQGDLERARNRSAIATTGADGLARVSVTPEIISRADMIVFLAAGPEKEEIASRLIETPDSVIAGQVVAKAVNVELWYVH